MRPRQRGRRHERVVERIDHKRGDMDMLEPGLTAGSIPVILRISEAVQRRGHKIVELIQRTARGHRMRIKKAGKLVEFVHRLALERIEKMTGIKQIKARSQSPPRRGKVQGNRNCHHAINQVARLFTLFAKPFQQRIAAQRDAYRENRNIMPSVLFCAATRRSIQSTSVESPA